MQSGDKLQSEQLLDQDYSSVNSEKLKHQEYFQNLQHKLILKSNKLSNFMGGSHLSKLPKAFSLNLEDDQTNDLANNGRKLTQSASMSPTRKKSKVFNKNDLQLGTKKLQKASKLLSVDDALQKLKKIKENLIQRKYYTRSSNSSGENQRIIAYDYDFALIQHNIKQKYPVNGQVQKIDPKQLMKLAFQQKKKMTQTISTTSSFQFPKIDSPLLKLKQVQIKMCLDDFQVIKPLGEGKFGTVFLARNKQTNFMCALKKMPRIFQDKSIVQQLIRQIKIQSFLDHPNICQLYTYFIQESHIYLVLQLCYSGNVYSVLRKQGRFPEQKVKNIIRQICHAIQYLHQHDIIHRDIKPQNIIFHQNIVKLCDFGWSVYSPLSRGTLCGTPIYASPQLVQRKQYDSKIDIWNIGVLTYQLLFGRVPFQIRCQDDLQKVIEQQIYFPKSIQISDIAKDFVRQCLNKNPQYRISIVKLLDHQFIYQKEKN